MLIFDTRTLGNKLLSIRKKAGLTQAEAAELSGLSDRAYADIERGSVNMRVETLIGICNALKITPDDVLGAKEQSSLPDEAAILNRLKDCSSSQRATAFKLLETYLNSL